MLNLVVLEGRLTNHVELKETHGGISVASVTIAVPGTYKNSQGEVKTEFIRCKLWRKNAENTALYCRKGSLISVKGKLGVRPYEKDGKSVYYMEVVAEEVHFLNTKASGSADTKVEDDVPEFVGEEIDVTEDELPF